MLLPEYLHKQYKNLRGKNLAVLPLGLLPAQRPRCQCRGPYAIAYQTSSSMGSKGIDSAELEFRFGPLSAPGHMGAAGLKLQLSTCEVWLWRGVGWPCAGAASLVGLGLLVCSCCEAGFSASPSPPDLQPRKVSGFLSWSSGFGCFRFLAVWGSRFETTAQHLGSMIAPAKPARKI